MPAVQWETLSNLKKGELEGSLSLTAQRARELIVAIDENAVASLADATRAYLDPVMVEIASLERALADDRAHVVRRAACFGAATPNRALGQSLGIGRYFADTIDWASADMPAITRAVMGGYLDGGKRKMVGLPTTYIHSLVDLAPALAAGRLPERETLATYRGISQKVASMMTAVIKPDRNIWTVDRHHLRQLLALAGADARVKDISYGTSEAYFLIEGFFLAYAGQHFPGMPVWAVQWATWNVAFGAHQSHARIWENEPC